MAEDIVKAPSPLPAPINIPAVDGVADQMSRVAAESSSLQPSAATDNGGDTVMGAANAGAPPTPDASPRGAPHTAEPAGPVPLDSPLRQVPIHPLLQPIKIPDDAVNTNPVTLQPFSDAELNRHGYEKLRGQIFAAADQNGNNTSTNGGGLSDREKEEIARIRDETAAALKHRLDERDAKVREIEREMEEKEKIREVERKVFRKKLAGGKEG